MVTLDELLDVGDRQRDRTRNTARVALGYLRVGLWSVGWVLAKLLTLTLAVLAGVFFGIGWLCARMVPALRWTRAAFTLGWEAGRASGGGRGTP